MHANAPASERLLSLDALRGFDMLWILGADAVMRALGRVIPFPPFTWLAAQFEHKEWAGFAFYDLIFPLFVFIVGVSSVFSLTKLIEQHGRAAALRRVAFRTALLFVLGLFYAGGFTNEWPGLRVLGVLQRIALAYGAASVLFCFLKTRALAAVAVLLLSGYWALLTFVPIRDITIERSAILARLEPGKPAPAEKYAIPARERVVALYDATTARVVGGYEPGRNLTNHLDLRLLPGRLYDGYYDPEGLLSTLPAVATALLGVLTGIFLRRGDLPRERKGVWLFAAGAACLALGFLWGLQFPIIKKIWTSSFVLVAGGWSLLLLSAFYHIVEIRGWRRWCQPFVWVGLNPITLYLISGIVGISRISPRLAGGDVRRLAESVLGPGGGNLVLALTTVALVLLLARFLHQRKIYLRA